MSKAKNKKAHRMNRRARRAARALVQQPRPKKP